MTLPPERALIVGAGPIGIACAISAKRRGLDPLVIDAGAVADAIVRYPVGMGFFTTPELLEIGGHPFTCGGPKPTREEALKYFRGVVRTEGIRVAPYTRLDTIRQTPAGLDAIVTRRDGTAVISAERIVLATGYYDNPNMLGVPGETRPHVSHFFDEAHRSYGLDVVVIGGKNSSIEAALELFRAGAHVTLLYRKTELPPSVKYWLRPDIENRIKAGEIAARLGAEVVRIDPDHVVIRRHDGVEERISAVRVYALTGYHPDFALFDRIGIDSDPATRRLIVDPETQETSVRGVYVAGSVMAGYRTGDIFIENGRFDGEKIFGRG